jgi:hypothetical protein
MVASDQYGYAQLVWRQLLQSRNGEGLHYAGVGERAGRVYLGPRPLGVVAALSQGFRSGFEPVIAHFKIRPVSLGILRIAPEAVFRRRAMEGIHSRPGPHSFNVILA